MDGLSWKDHAVRLVAAAGIHLVGTLSPGGCFQHSETILFLSMVIASWHNWNSSLEQCPHLFGNINQPANNAQPGCDSVGQPGKSPNWPGPQAPVSSPSPIRSKLGGGRQPAVGACPDQRARAEIWVACLFVGTRGGGLGNRVRGG